MNFDFYKRLEFVGQRIPCGKVATYGQLASLCGKPKNARQVGYALRANKLESSIPAHRIVNGQGLLSGAGAFSSSGLQKRLLQKEGVIVSSNNRVDLKIFQWDCSLDIFMEFYDIFRGLDI
jgi:O-6-methylguanine DNA methyltransferase